MSELYTAVVNLEISEISFCGNLHTAVLVTITRYVGVQNNGDIDNIALILYQ